MGCLYPYRVDATKELLGEPPHGTLHDLILSTAPTGPFEYTQRTRIDTAVAGADTSPHYQRDIRGCNGASAEIARRLRGSWRVAPAGYLRRAPLNDDARRYFGGMLRG